MLAARDTPLQYKAAGSPWYLLLDVLESELCGQPPGDLPGAIFWTFYGSKILRKSSVQLFIRCWDPRSYFLMKPKSPGSQKPFISLEEARLSQPSLMVSKNCLESGAGTSSGGSGFL